MEQKEAYFTRFETKVAKSIGIHNVINHHWYKHACQITRYIEDALLNVSVVKELSTHQFLFGWFVAI